MTKERAIKILNSWDGVYIGYSSDEVNEATKVATEALEQEQKWISVDDGLPNNDEDVLVCFSQGGMAVGYYHIDNTCYPGQYADLNETGWCNEEGDAFYFEPVAWMPLPKPYKVGDNT